MSKRTPQTFAKRQRELARQEKQERKRAKRLERKHQKAHPEGAAGEPEMVVAGVEGEAPGAQEPPAVE